MLTEIAFGILIFIAGVLLGYQWGYSSGYRIGWLVGGIARQKEIDSEKSA